MATHLARLVTVILVLRGSVTAGSEEILWRVKRDSSEESASSSSSSPSASTCPCTQGCCERGWFQYRDACYKAVFESKMWHDAEEHCLAHESHLASIHSHEEDNFILHVMRNQRSYWIGAQGTRQGNEWQWTWTDQSPFEYKASVTICGFNEHCYLTAGRINDQGTIAWRQHFSHTKHSFICKYMLA
ncbi:snaclec rhodocetin subunit delta-like isoform X2 [Paroedura picta]|uniref:snaclec rhodocetin subunit delta-like isoform X2 n=1 Tax=Paroedura picta TaxID=143630 RepID=UPI004055B8FF